MLINEVCKECNLTKKAVEYYTEQGLIQPRITENGYGSLAGNLRHFLCGLCSRCLLRCLRCCLCGFDGSLGGFLRSLYGPLC